MKSSQTSSRVGEKSGIKYTQRHVRRLVQKGGYSLITPRKKHKNAASEEGVGKFKRNQAFWWNIIYHKKRRRFGRSEVVERGRNFPKLSIRRLPQSHFME